MAESRKILALTLLELWALKATLQMVQAGGGAKCDPEFDGLFEKMKALVDGLSREELQTVRAHSRQVIRNAFCNGDPVSEKIGEILLKKDEEEGDWPDAWGAEPEPTPDFEVFKENFRKEA